VPCECIIGLIYRNVSNRLSVEKGYIVLYGNTARDGGTEGQRSTTRYNRGLTTASPSSASVDGVAMLVDWDPCVGYCDVINDVCCECARCYRKHGV